MELLSFGGTGWGDELFRASLMTVAVALTAYTFGFIFAFIFVPLKLSKNKLLKHLHSLPDQPNAIPYMTSYYKKYSGFCVTHKQKILFKNKYKNSDQFKVVIKSKFNPNGKLNYGELVLKGKSKQEILISTYICHPSMANNELSGPIVSMSLINYQLQHHA